MLGNVPVCVYRINTPDGAELAISRIEKAGNSSGGSPVILLHGNYAKRNFWISQNGVGLGEYLGRCGLDVWIPELRGHGLSPKGAAFSAITAEEQIRYDIPAIQDFVYSRTGTALSWSAHSSGGVYLLAALSAGWLSSDAIRRIVLFGSQISKGERYLKIPFLSEMIMALIRRIGYFPAPRFGLGPEIESAETMCEIIGWKKFWGKWRTREGFDYMAGMERIRIPILAFAGAADKNDPPSGCREFIEKTRGETVFKVLGRRGGFSRDYDHVDMVVSKTAADEVWPLVAEWLDGAGA